MEARAQIVGARPVVAIILFMVVGVGAGMYLIGMKDTEVVVRMPLTSAPATRTFAVGSEGNIAVWADLDVAHSELNPYTPNDSLPHVIDYVVQIQRGDEPPIVRRCNPFDSHIARTTDRTSELGKPATRAYDGLLDGCAFQLSPGRYTLTASVDAVADDPRIQFRKHDLVLRTHD